MTDFVRVGSLAEVPEGELRPYEVPTGRVAVAHDESRIFAFADECTYGGCSLSEGSFDDRLARVTCSRDDSVFDAETGEPLDGPARDPLAIYLARVVEGWIEIATAPGVSDA